MLVLKFSDFYFAFPWFWEGYANGQASGLLNRDGLKSRLWVRVPPLPLVKSSLFYATILNLIEDHLKYKKLYRYTANGEGIWSAGKRLLPEDLIEEAWEARKWMPKPQLPDGDYRFYLTEKGKEKYESVPHFLDTSSTG